MSKVAQPESKLLLGILCIILLYLTSPLFFHQHIIDFRLNANIGHYFKKAKD